MIRMLLIGYCFGIRSERRLCEQSHLNLEYRCFCHFHPQDNKSRHGRFRDAGLFRCVFEWIIEGLYKKKHYDRICYFHYRIGNLDMGVQKISSQAQRSWLLSVLCLGVHISGYSYKPRSLGFPPFFLAPNYFLAAFAPEHIFGPSRNWPSPHYWQSK